VEACDLLIVGGGINGVGIARDAAGRGLRVVLVEQGDLGCGTSSASSKLVHGGLRYLEQLEFRLVAESLAEREILLRAAPHLVRPLRFLMPHARELRPSWMIRTGLFLYDWLARRQTLPASAAVDLAASPFGAGLQPRYETGYVYSDCWVDDARLVIANALAAAEAGAHIYPRTMCIAAERTGDRWRARLAGRTETEVEARALVNAAGPFVAQFLTTAAGQPAGPNVRLVQGSHIVVPALYGGEHACILQNDDRRVVFAYPYERHYTLVGTTDLEHRGDPGSCRAASEEVAYLCRAVNRYFSRQVQPSDVKWSYCGLRALVDDGSGDPSKITRDYLLRVDGESGQGPVLSVFGGKITTYRRLAERALERLRPWFSGLGRSWTATATLPGGDIPVDKAARLADALAARHNQLPRDLMEALVSRHGSRVNRVLEGVHRVEDLGVHFGADLYAREVDYFMTHEWARQADDVLWRRTKAGLHLDAQQQVELFRYMAGRTAETL
jgi:glycerol-3-phosphate dehydrogenase